MSYINGDYIAKNAGKLWTENEEKHLINLVKEQRNIRYICKKMLRNYGGITARIYRLESEGKIPSYAAAYYAESNEPELIPMPKVMEKHVSNKSGKTWTMVSMLQEGIITVKVQFDEEGKKYTYKTRDKSLAIDDYVITNPGAIEGLFTIGKIVEIDTMPDFNPDSGLRYHWIVAKIDCTEYNELVKQDERAYELLKSAEKHVARQKLVSMYQEALGVSDINELKQLLKDTI